MDIDNLSEFPYLSGPEIGPIFPDYGFPTVEIVLIEGSVQRNPVRRKALWEIFFQTNQQLVSELKLASKEYLSKDIGIYCTGKLKYLDFERILILAEFQDQFRQRSFKGWGCGVESFIFRLIVEEFLIDPELFEYRIEKIQSLNIGQHVFDFPDSYEQLTKRGQLALEKILEPYSDRIEQEKLLFQAIKFWKTCLKLTWWNSVRFLNWQAHERFRKFNYLYFNRKSHCFTSY